MFWSSKNIKSKKPKRDPYKEIFFWKDEKQERDYRRTLSPQQKRIWDKYNECYELKASTEGMGWFDENSVIIPERAKIEKRIERLKTEIVQLEKTTKLARPMMHFWSVGEFNDYMRKHSLPKKRLRID